MAILMIPFNYRCRAHSLLSVTSGAVVTLDAAKVLHATYGPAQAVMLSIETAAIRRTMDGTTPTTGAAGVGGILASGDSLLLAGGGNVKNLKMIAVSTTAPVQVDYFYEK